MTRRLRVPLEPLAAGERTLPAEAARYVARVHRLSTGDVFVAFDPESRTEADVELLSVRPEVRCRVGDVRAATAVARTGVTLLQGLGKSDKPERVVRDATALGAARVVLVETGRSVVRLAERGQARQRRWKAVAVDAARQCGRGDLPEIDGPTSLAAALDGVSATPPERRLCLSPEADVSFDAALGDFRLGEPVALLVGPEGGFDAAEIEQIAIARFISVRLGDFVLRTEIAAIAALGAVLARPRRP